MKLRASSARQRLYPALPVHQKWLNRSLRLLAFCVQFACDRGGFCTQGLKLIAAVSMAGAACFGSGTANARFLQVDPVGYEDQVNLYAYVGNDPINAADPSGKACVPQKDGSSVCDPPGEDIGSFTIPAKENPGYIGPNAAGYHVYNG